jgi:hypothetical protein
VEDGQDAAPGDTDCPAVGLLLVCRSGKQALNARTRRSNSPASSLDAGVEYAIWKPRYVPSSRLIRAVLLTPVPVTPAMSLNGFSPLSATALAFKGYQWNADQAPERRPRIAKSVR